MKNKKDMSGQKWSAFCKAIKKKKKRPRRRPKVDLSLKGRLQGEKNGAHGSLGARLHLMQEQAMNQQRRAMVREITERSRFELGIAKRKLLSEKEKNSKSKARNTQPEKLETRRKGGQMGERKLAGKANKTIKKLGSFPIKYYEFDDGNGDFSIIGDGIDESAEGREGNEKDEEGNSCRATVNGNGTLVYLRLNVEGDPCYLRIELGDYQWMPLGKRFLAFQPNNTDDNYNNIDSTSSVNENEEQETKPFLLRFDSHKDLCAFISSFTIKNSTTANSSVSPPSYFSSSSSSHTTTTFSSSTTPPTSRSVSNNKTNSTRSSSSTSTSKIPIPPPPQPPNLTSQTFSPINWLPPNAQQQQQQQQNFRPIFPALPSLNNNLVLNAQQFAGRPPLTPTTPNYGLLLRNNNNANAANNIGRASAALQNRYNGIYREQTPRFSAQITPLICSSETFVPPIGVCLFPTISTQQQKQ